MVAVLRYALANLNKLTCLDRSFLRTHCTQRHSHTQLTLPSTIVSKPRSMNLGSTVVFTGQHASYCPVFDSPTLPPLLAYPQTAVRVRGAVKLFAFDPFVFGSSSQKKWLS